MTEEQLHQECYMWFHNTFPQHRRMLFHIDNNSYNATVGARKKSLGVIKGVSDLIFIVESAVIFIELKIGTNGQSDEQKDFQAKVEARHHLYFIIKSLEAFKAIIIELLK